MNGTRSGKSQKLRADSRKSAYNPVMGRINRIGMSFVVAGICGAAFSWNDAGHMTVATIAYGELKPEVKVKVDMLLATMGKDFVLGSPWADDIRGQRLGEPPHYVNIHFRSDGRPSNNKPNTPNVVSVLADDVKILGDARLPDKVRAEALLYVIHFVADIHEPMHAVAQDTAQYPQGDRGGTLFLLAGKPSELHSYWDSGGTLLPAFGDTIEPEELNAVSAMAKSLAARNPAAPTQLLVQSPQEWAKEGFTIARETAYKIKPKTKPSREYAAECRKTSEQRIVLAGKRLAVLLNNLLG
jgi:hypothetical protein